MVDTAKFAYPLTSPDYDDSGSIVLGWVAQSRALSHAVRFACMTSPRCQGVRLEATLRLKRSERYVLMGDDVNFE
jgi:hypothetical protein